MFSKTGGILQESKGDKITPKKESQEMEKRGKITALYFERAKLNDKLLELNKKIDKLLAE